MRCGHLFLVAWYVDVLVMPRAALIALAVVVAAVDHLPVPLGLSASRAAVHRRHVQPARGPRWRTRLRWLTAPRVSLARTRPLLQRPAPQCALSALLIATAREARLSILAPSICTVRLAQLLRCGAMSPRVHCRIRPRFCR